MFQSAAVEWKFSQGSALELKLSYSEHNAANHFRYLGKERPTFQPEALANYVAYMRLPSKIERKADTLPKLNDTLPKLNIEVLARQYAWQLGHDDYPVADICPYNRAKHLDLHAKYWKGWHTAATEDRRIRRLSSVREDQ